MWSLQVKKLRRRKFINGRLVSHSKAAQQTPACFSKYHGSLFLITGPTDPDFLLLKWRYRGRIGISHGVFLERKRPPRLGEFRLTILA
jgi:hypothetical protein